MVRSKEPNENPIFRNTSTETPNGQSKQRYSLNYHSGMLSLRKAFSLVLLVTLLLVSIASGVGVSAYAQNYYLPPFSIYGAPTPPTEIAVQNSTGEYWGPYVQSIYFTWFTSSEAALEALVNNYIQWDAAGVGTPQNYQELMPYIQSGQIAVNVTPTNSFGYIGFNYFEYPFNNYHFREAIQQLTDYKEIASYLDNGLLGIASPYYFEPLVYGPYFSAQEADAYQKYGSFNLTAAIQDLEAAGLVDHPAQGYWTYPNGTQVQPIPITIPSGPSVQYFLEIFQTIINNAAKINLTLTTSVISFNTEITLMREHDLPMFTLGVGLGAPVNPTYLYYVFGPGSFNVRSRDYHNPYLWSLVTKLLEASTYQQALNYSVQAATFLQIHVPVVILDWGTSLTPVRVDTWRGYIDEAPYGQLFTADIHPSNSVFGSLYRFGQPEPPNTLNLYSATTEYDFQVLDTETISPFQISYSNPTALAPEAAYNYTVSTGAGIMPNGHPYSGSTITIKFLPDIVWWDGVPLTATDFNFTLWWLDVGGYPSNPYNPKSDTVTVDPGVIINYTAESLSPSREYYGEAPGFVGSYVPPDNPYEIILYFNTTSIFNILNVYGLPIFPEHLFWDIQPSTFAHEAASKYLAQEVFAGEYWFYAWSPAANYVQVEYFPSYFLSNPYTSISMAGQGENITYTFSASVFNTTTLTSSSGNYYETESPVVNGKGIVYILNNQTLNPITSFQLTPLENGTYVASIPTSKLPIGTYIIYAEVNWTGTPYPYFEGNQTTSDSYHLYRYGILEVLPTTSTSTTTSQTSLPTTPTVTTTSSTTTSKSSSNTLMVLAAVVIVIIIVGIVLILRRNR